MQRACDRGGREVFYQHSRADAELRAALLRPRKRLLRAGGTGPPSIGRAGNRRRQQSDFGRNRCDVAGRPVSFGWVGRPVKVISVPRDRQIHELIVGAAINQPAEMKGKSIAVGSLDGTAAIM